MKRPKQQKQPASEPTTAGATSPSSPVEGKRARCGNCRLVWSRAVLRTLETPSRLGTGGAEETAGDRLDDGRLRAVRASGADERLGAMLAIKEFNDKGGVLGPQDRVAPYGHRDDTRDRLARGGAHDHPQRGGVPRRRAALGRRQRHLAGRPEVRLRLPQHELKLADRGRARTATAPSSCGTATEPTSPRRSSRTR